jgi:[protein-PII] uridylyltransferase
MLLTGYSPVDSEPQILVSEKISTLMKEIKDVTHLSILMEPYPGYERLTFCAIDRSKLFTDFAGCLSSEGYNILNAQINTTAEGKAVDVFTVEPDTTTRIPSEQRLEKIQKKWQKLVTGETDIDDLIQERKRLYPLEPVRQSVSEEPEIIIDNEVSSECTVIEIHSGDRMGLLYTIASVLDKLHINIVSAKLSTKGRVVADVFYVNSADKLKIDPSQFELIKGTLLEMIAN